MSQLYNGQQDYSPEILNVAANALGVEPFELLMTPERAMAMRRLYADAVRIVRSDDTAPFNEDGPDSDDNGLGMAVNS